MKDEITREDRFRNLKGLGRSRKRVEDARFTQGKGELDALKQTLCEPRIHTAFVGISRKFSPLAGRLEAAGLARADIARIKASAGLDIVAVTPEEIALSILAERVAVRCNTVKSNGG